MLKIFSTLLKNLRPRASILYLSLFIFSGFSFTQIAYAANLKLSPASGSYTVGQTISVDVLVANNTDNINGASASISFSNDTLEISSISKSGSILTIWAEEPNFSNASGKASMEGVLLNPGFSGAQAKVATIIFKAKATGVGTVTISSGSVLANDGNGTNVVGTLGSASFTIKDKAVVKEVVAPPVDTSGEAGNTLTPVITSSTYPDHNKWYNGKDASFEWELPSGVTAVRTAYNKNESGMSGSTNSLAISSKSFTVNSSGILYMHVQFKTKNGWGNIDDYKFQIDMDAPENLKAVFPDGASTVNGTPSIMVTAEDKLSGMDYIAMSVDGNDSLIYPLDSSNLYKLPKQTPGKHTVIVGAVDKAGNVSKTTLDYDIQTLAVPVITEYTKNLESGNPFRVAGTTYPQKTVEIELTDRDGNAKTENTTANDSGIFNFTWDGKLPVGVYELRARVIDAKGLASDYTEVKVVFIENIALIRFCILVINWLSLILIIIIAIVAIIATLWFSLKQFARFRKSVNKMISSTENVVNSSAVVIRKDLEDFRGRLEAIERSKAEEQRKEELHKKEIRDRLASIYN